MALRNIDWAGFLSTHDYRYAVILRDIAQGRTALNIVRDCGESYFHIRQLKERLEEDLTQIGRPLALEG